MRAGNYRHELKKTMMDITTIIPQRLASYFGVAPAGTEYGPIGIDLGTRGLRMVQFCKRGEQLVITNSVFVAYAEGANATSDHAIEKLLRKTLRKYNFVGREAVSCMPDMDTRIFMLNYLLSQEKDDETIITQRMAERLDEDLSDYIIDYMLVRPEGGVAQERSALVAVADQEQVIRHLEILRKAGLRVQALEIEPMSIRRLISVKHLHESIANLISVSIGKEQTFLTVLSGRRLIYEREIDFGEYDILNKLSEALDMSASDARRLMQRTMVNPDYQPGESGMTPDQLYNLIKPLFGRLVEDINKALIYAASETRGMEVRQIYFTGSVSRWGVIIDNIQSMVEVPTAILLPVDGFTTEHDIDNDTRDTVATGLALRGLTGVN